MPTPRHTARRVIVLGDQDTGGQRTDMLVGKAAEQRASIAEVHTFEPGEPSSHDDLAEVGAVVTALSRALTLRADIWVPFWREDLGREEHLRRLSLVLHRHGLNLLLGQTLWPYPREGGLNEVDAALRREVRAVDDLDHAALATAALPTLHDDIARALHTGNTEPAGATAQPCGESTAEVINSIEADFGPAPPLPSTTAAWPQRRRALKRFAGWLVTECGLTQTDTAKLLNATGHRTARGRLWQRSTVSALVNDRYDRRSAA
ncbi:MAG: hypothetical protein K0U76_08915 [Actinomycetia bacterium]|nr:hypothetical protein [Actinomycetes bacterium]MCH9701497.1 hypothetical protein [Actinomycetes bacterium]